MLPPTFRSYQNAMHNHILSFLIGGLLCSSCIVSTQGPPGTPPEVPLPPHHKTAHPQAEAKKQGPLQVAARHILISYRGAMRAAPYIEKSKEQAREFAQDLQKKIASGADFSKLAEEHSDDPGSAAQGGALGTFKREQMVPAFSDTAFALEIGEVSEVVESPFGFHIILRDE